MPKRYTKNLAVYGLNAQALCDHHYDALRLLVKTSYLSLSDGLVDDFVRLKILMMDKATCRSHLATLDTNMPVLDAHSPKGPRIGMVLTCYENRCYFPNFLIVPLGFIANGFDNLGRCGFLAMKDVGAGIGHGKYTHRMQWHIAMRTITNQFQSAHGHWNHSPLELFLTAMSSSGNISANETMGINHHSTNLFGFIFDLSGDGAGSYSWPDELFDEMRKTAVYPNIGRSSHKNWLKRNTEDQIFRNTWAQYENDLRNRQQLAKNLYDARFKRDNSMGPSKWLANRAVGKAKRLYNAVATPVKPLSPSEQMQQKLQQSGNWQNMGQIENANPFQLPNHDNQPIDYGDAILVPHNTPMPGSHDIQQALIASRAQLNPAQALPNGQSGFP